MPLKGVLTFLCNLSFLNSRSQVSTDLLLSLYMRLHFPELSRNGLIQCIYTLFSLVSFTGCSDLGIIVLLSTAMIYPLLLLHCVPLGGCITGGWFIHSPVSAPVTCFRFGAVTNKAACLCECMLFLWGTYLGTKCLDPRCILTSQGVKSFPNWLSPFTVTPAVNEKVSSSNILIDTSYDWSSPF